MLTYLLIFLSIVVLVVIFVRQVYLVLLKKKPTPEDVAAEEAATAEAAAVVAAEMPPSSVELRKAEPKKRISRERKSKVEKLHNRAIALINKREPKEAVKTLVSGLAIDPNNLDAQKELGRLYLDQKMWVKAAAVYKGLAEKTNDPVDYSHLGLSLYNAGELDEAAMAYQQAITLDPDRSQRYVSLGQVYKDAGKLPLALIAFNKALELEIGNVDYLLVTADTHIKMENYGEADALLHKVLDIAPMSKIARKMLKEIEKLKKLPIEDMGNV
jgi:tetratricopeptide (TPR) repeat protein